MPRESALLTSAGRMPERSQHRVSEAQDGRSERPALGAWAPRPALEVDEQMPCRTALRLTRFSQSRVRMERGPGAWYNIASAQGSRPFPDVPSLPFAPEIHPRSSASMAKPHRNLKKANHGARPANSKARKAKRKHIRT